jgi:hypothetical protein
MLLSWSGSAAAIDRIVLEADEIAAPVARIASPRVELNLSGAAPRVLVTAEQMTLADRPADSLTAVRIECGEITIREPTFACGAGHVFARGGPLGAIDTSASALYRSDRDVFEAQVRGLALAGGELRVAATMDADGWNLRADAQPLEISRLRELAAPWLALPATYSTSGKLAAVVEASGGNGAATHIKLDTRTADFDLGNEAGSIVAEKVALRVRGTARLAGSGVQIQTTLEGFSGQALAGPVLLDFAANPLKVTMRGAVTSDSAKLDEVAIEQKGLLTARGAGTLRLAQAPFVQHAHVDIDRILFPAAYRSFVQIALAATDFGTLEATGSASGAVDLRNDAIERADLHIEHVDLVDERTQFFMNDVQGELHWAPDAIGSSPELAAVNLVQVPDSTLAWSKMRAYGLSGGTARLDFRARGTSFALTREARVPVFDGALLVHALDARGLGSEGAQLDFDADIEPISMALLSKAFGWPELAGELSGRIPGLTYRNGVLAFNGDVTAQVFDGAITGSNFRLQDPLGPWPRLFADVTARHLDLELLTRTFSIGSITGRLDADLEHLELFNWSPVAFDARLYSTPGDRSAHRISQKAVTSISSIGGGSGGVSRALQSGVLRFFQEFRYDRMGIACRLRNEICQMSGIEPRDGGYYLVKGSGLPRIDIIGNEGRVDWPQLLSQIETAMSSEGGPVVR